MDWLGTINECTFSWTLFLIYRVIDFTLLFGLIGIFWMLFHKKWSARFGYFLFLIALAQLVIPFHILIPAYRFIPNLYWDLSGHYLSMEKIEESFNDIFLLADPAQAGTHTVNINRYRIATTTSVFVLWSAVSFFVAMFLVWREWKTYRKIWHLSPLNPEKIPLNSENLQSVSGISGPIRWVTGSWIKSPMVYGLRNPVIAVPQDIQQDFTSNQLRWIILHELAHIRRRDGLVSIIQKILLTMFFFHPLVWWANSIINRLREYDCDDEAISGSQASLKECGEGFLGVVMRTHGLPTFLPVAFGIINYGTLVKKRIMRILDKHRNPVLKISLQNGFSFLFITIIVLPLLVFGMDYRSWGQIQTDPVGIFQNHVDIGNPSPPGDAEYNSKTGEYQVKGGTGGGASVDSWHFVYRELSGDFSIKARVRIESSPKAHPGSGAALMIREDLSPDSKFYMGAVLVNGKLRPAVRSVYGNDWLSESVALSSTYDHNGRIEVVRKGSTATFYYEDTNGNRNLLDTHQIDLNDPVYVGFIVTSFSFGEFNTGYFSDVEIVPLQ